MLSGCVSGRFAAVFKEEPDALWMAPKASSFVHRGAKEAWRVKFNKLDFRGGKFKDGGLSLILRGGRIPIS
jgi:hypothetical protein